MLLWICLPPTVQGADTGYRTAGAIVSSGSWSNFTTTRINNSDNSRAWVSSSDSYGVASTYGFSIPSGSTINGIVVQVEGNSNSGLSSVSYGIQLSWNNGASWVTEKTASFLSIFDSTDSFGSSTDTWGRTWTDTDFSDSNFQFRIYKTGGFADLYVDYIQIRVYYTVNKLWDRGAGSNNWGDGNNWNPDGVPTASENVILTGADTIDINVAATANDVTLNNSGLMLTILSSYSLAVSGDLTMQNGTLNTQASFPTVSGTVSLAGGTFGYTASGAQTVSTRTYYNLTLGGSGTKTMPGTAFTVAGNFVMSGTPSATAAAAMTVNGDFTIGNGCTFGAGSYTHNLGGNFANNGTFTASTSTMNFTGAASTAISGSSTTTFNDLTVNKGSNTASVLEATSVIAMASGGLTLTNGTLKLSSNSTITPFTADITSSPYLIPISAGLWVNGGTVSATSSMTCQGLLRVSTGTLNAGNAADEGITAASGFALTIDGGTVNVAGRLTRLSTSNPINFTMSSGTLTVGNVGNTSTAIAPFCIDQSGLSFSMSGGTIIVRNEGGTGAKRSRLCQFSRNHQCHRRHAPNWRRSTSAGQTMQINSSAPDLEPHDQRRQLPDGQTADERADGAE